MIDPITKLDLTHDDNGVFNNNIENGADYVRDNYFITLSSTEDYLYMGYDRPFGTVYHEIIVPNTVGNVFSAQIYIDGVWTGIFLTDDTRGFLRSGYMFWDKTLMEATTIGGIERYWIRIRPSADHTQTQIRATNLIFADDCMLKQEFFEIDNANLLPPGESSHVVHHVAARNAIVQRLRNLNYIKIDSESQKINLTQWDLHDIFEIRQAATFLALAKIFFNLSDSPEDNWFIKYREYQDRYEEAFRLARISLDSNNNGLQDDNETLTQAKVFRFTR